MSVSGGPSGLQERSFRRSVAGHRARQLRARIVTLARAYLEACGAYEQADADVDGGDGTLAAWEQCGEAMDRARNALFSALDELDVLEGRRA